jgi:ATP-dependent DNA helicase RecG
VIAREDLRIRGPGEFIGARQSGVPLLRYADLEEDAALVDIARGLAEEILRDAPRWPTRSPPAGSAGGPTC